MTIQRESFPLPDTDWEPTREYWAAAERSELRIPRCTSCDTWIWYPKENCPACGASEMRWDQLSGRATLFSYVVVNHAFLPQYRGLSPFLPALVVPEEAPTIRLTTRLIESEPSKLEMDMPLEVIFTPLTFEGVQGEVIAPLFRPVTL